MIKVLYGGRGQGMSRELCDMANERVRTASGSVVFIDKDDKHIYDLDSGIRLINASDYLIEGPKMFSGFISGISAQDHDLELIFVCSFIKLVKHPISSLEGLFGFFEEFSERSGADFVIEVNTDEECPEFLKKYL
ncbi:MAG: twitching motility protein PilT [Clostridiales bacterium]|nr:twitching motility protein PilT [Clostridiales bacterium]